MTTGFAVKLFQDTVLHILVISAPILLSSLIVGLLVSIFQATTTIQEPTLTFVPKIIVVFLALFFLFSFMIQYLTNFANKLFLMFPDMVK